MSVLLEARGVTLARTPRGPAVIEGLDLALERGELVALVGANAAGKSTALAALSRELRPRAGSIRLGGADAFALAPRAFARRVARLPQDPQCVPGVTVESLVRCGRFPHATPWRATDARGLARVEEALERTGTAALRRRRVDELSGGERRRAWLALVLAQDADVLLLDEPCAGLDLLHRLQLLELLRAQVCERGATVVCALHELDDAARFADRVAVLAGGRLLALGPPASVLSPATLRDAFGVEAELRRDGGLPSLRVYGAAGA